MAKVYAISLDIFKSSLGDCSNHGISSRFNKVYYLCDDGYIALDSDNLPENTVKLVTRQLFGKTYNHLEPVRKTDAGCVGWMAGGTYCASSDSRFPFSVALSLHDRQETQAQYDALSR